MVMIQAQTILEAKPQRTDEARFAVPAPIIAPVIVCVVDTGMPKLEAMNRVMAPAKLAQAPCIGESLVIFEPMVFTMRQPPNIVPNPIVT